MIETVEYTTHPRGTKIADITFAIAPRSELRIRNLMNGWVQIFFRYTPINETALIVNRANLVAELTTLATQHGWLGRLPALLDAWTAANSLDPQDVVVGTGR